MNESDIPGTSESPIVCLASFISENRDEVIRRCQEKFRARSGTALNDATGADGVPLFLSQIVDEVDPSPSLAREIRQGASTHGRHLFFEGFSVGQVVHSFGDVCQAVTELAVERGAHISAEDFRAFNGNLDNAIAAAVSEYARQDRAARGDADIDEAIELQNLVYTALTAFEAIQAGTVGISGTTGLLVHRSLLELRSVVQKRKAALKDA